MRFYLSPELVKMRLSWVEENSPNIKSSENCQRNVVDNGEVIILGLIIKVSYIVGNRGLGKSRFRLQKHHRIFRTSRGEEKGFGRETGGNTSVNDDN